MYTIAIQNQWVAFITFIIVDVGEILFNMFLIGLTMSATRPLTDKEYAECFDAFKKVSSEWTAMGEWLEKEFLLAWLEGSLQVC